MRYQPHHTAISVRDIEASRTFYATLGFRQVHRYEEDDGSMVIVHLKLGETFIEIFGFPENAAKNKLHLEYANSLKDLGVKHIALRTDDITAALDDLRQKGLANQTTEITFGTNVAYFFIQDPDGMWVEIIKDDRYT